MTAKRSDAGPQVQGSPLIRLARRWLPPGLRQFGNRLMGQQLRFVGDYADWSSAAAAGSYDAAGILDRVEQATRLAMAQGGEERDGVLLETPASPGQLILAVQKARALTAPDPPRILDFGGALGSHWLSGRRHWTENSAPRWKIVEQVAYVQRARTLYSEGGPSFHEDLLGALTEGRPTLVIASSVLQYLPDPWTSLAALLDCHAPLLFIDRTPFINQGATRLTLQINPRARGGHRYPMWLLQTDRVQAQIEAQYRIVERFDSLDRNFRWRGQDVHYRGLLAVRRDDRESLSATSPT